MTTSEHEAGVGWSARLRSDGARYWTATALSAALTGLGVAAAFGTGLTTRVDTSFVAIVYFATWILYCLCYSAITWRVLAPADGATLVDWLREDDGQRHSRRRTETMYGTGGPSAAVALCGIALTAVLLVAALADLRGNPVTVGLAVVVVVTTWLQLLVIYALHYAREHTRAGGLAFPGHRDEAPVFSDFVYVATLVATSLATSDVAVHSSAMRREVTVHAVIAFAYNTVVIALLVSLLISVSG